MDRNEILELLRNNLTISIETETNGFMTTDGSTSTRVEVTILLEDEIVSTDSFSA